eukprot:GHVS01079702.1.p1 GENE.GHVS01079702.1~~GHVS01079702.1.p1  ORF type:complete len:324 (+),score=94.00 GHVS01079702.1:120-1091(+)
MTALSVCQLADTLLYTASLRRGVPTAQYENFVSHYSKLFHHLAATNPSVYVAAASRVFSPSTWWSYVQLMLAYLQCTHCNLTDYALWWVEAHNNHNNNRGGGEEVVAMGEATLPPLCGGNTRPGDMAGRQQNNNIPTEQQTGGISNEEEDVVIGWLAMEMRLVAEEMQQMWRLDITPRNSKQEEEHEFLFARRKRRRHQEKSNENDVIMQRETRQNQTKLRSSSSSASSEEELFSLTSFSMPFSMVFPSNSPVFSTAPFSSSPQSANYYLNLIASTEHGQGEVFHQLLTNTNKEEEEVVWQERARRLIKLALGQFVEEASSGR